MGTTAFDLRLVEPFVVLVDEGLHFRAAAERLGIGQPALSRQMARLQHELGVTLVVRDGRESLLTPAGTRFLVHARAIMRRGAALQEALRVDGAALRLHLGNASHRRIGEIVSSFIAAHPSLVLQVAEDTSTAAVEALRRHDADVVFGVRTGCPPGMVFALLERAPLGLLTAAGNPLAARPEVGWADLESQPVFFGPDPAGHSNLLVRACLADAGVTVREVIGPVLGKLHYLALPVARGDASLVASRSLFDPLPPGLAWRPLVPHRQVDFGIMWDPHLTPPAARRFIEFAAPAAAAPAPVPAAAAPGVAAGSRLQPEAT